MNGRELFFSALVFTIAIAIDHHSIISDRNPHIRQKRFVFFPGSVLQLAAGLAIPAGVKNKIIYTNYGIMINYELPTNLSSLLPISIVEEMRGSKSWDQLSADLFLRFGWNKRCWLKLEKWADGNKKLNGSLVHEVVSTILRERETNELLRSHLLQDIESSLDACPLLDG